MSWWTDLLQDIPLTAVLKERLALAEQKFKDMEAENKKLKEQAAALREENDALKRRIADAPMAIATPKEEPQIKWGCYYFNGDESKLYCPRCYETQNKKHPTARMGVKARQCTVCGNGIPS